MTPVYDKDAALVAWLDGEHLFDTAMEWLAFVSRDALFSARTGAWLGTLGGGSLLDTDGKVVGWVPGRPPRGAVPPVEPLPPVRPVRPLKPPAPTKPLKPARPVAPLGGWSARDWATWVAS